ncbi:hypothetical protein HK405_014280 [Cladochytrium tenue]|nr:hypothetical protein HK405_014280 [Cladochytrium tenue]
MLDNDAQAAVGFRRAGAGGHRQQQQQQRARQPYAHYTSGSSTQSTPLHNAHTSSATSLSSVTGTGGGSISYQHGSAGSGSGRASAIPDFRRIYQASRTAEEENRVVNAAVFKFVSFLAIVVFMTALRKTAFPQYS